MASSHRMQIVEELKADYAILMGCVEFQETEEWKLWNNSYGTWKCVSGLDFAHILIAGFSPIHMEYINKEKLKIENRK